MNVDTVGTTTFQGRGSSARLTIIADDFGDGTVQIQVRRGTDTEDRWTTINPNGTFVGTALPASEIIEGVRANDIIRAVLSGSSGALKVWVEVSDIN